MPNYKNEKSSTDNQKLIRKNFYILKEIYKSLTQDEEVNLNFYENNFFYENIKEFFISYEYMNSVVELKDKDPDKE